QFGIRVEAAGIIDVIAEGGAPAEIPAQAVAALEGEVEAHARRDGEPEAGIVLQLGGQLAQLVELAGVVDLPLGLAEVYGGAYIGEEPEISAVPAAAAQVIVLEDGEFRADVQLEHVIAEAQVAAHALRVRAQVIA